MNVLKPMTMTPVITKKSSNYNMDITSNKEKKLLLTRRNKRSDIVSDNGVAINKRKKPLLAGEIIKNKIINESKSLARLPVKSKKAISIDREKKLKRNNLSTNNNNYKRRPLNESNSRKKIESNIGLKQHETKMRKTTEDIILEEVSKHKFKAKPFSREKVGNKVNSLKVLNDIKMQESSDQTVAKIDELPEILTENNLNTEKENHVKSTRRNKITNLHIARSISKNRKSNEKLFKDPAANQNDSGKENHVFKAKPMPDFKLKEVKRSTNNLTIPNPPKLSNFQKSVLRNSSKE